MEPQKLAERVHALMVENNFERAEELLLEARKKAETEGDAQTLQYILTELVGLCHISEPPLWAKAESLSNERERSIPSAYNKLQTAMILHHGTLDYPRAVAKLEEAIAQGKTEHDDGTVYTSLGLLGQTHLMYRKNKNSFYPYIVRRVALMFKMFKLERTIKVLDH